MAYWSNYEVTYRYNNEDEREVNLLCADVRRFNLQQQGNCFPLISEIQLPLYWELTEHQYAEAVTSLVQKTWRADLVGKGNDAVGLGGYSSITVLNVYRVNNHDVRRRYESRIRDLRKKTDHSVRPHHVLTKNRTGMPHALIKTIW